jgi:hypothetical protein
MTTVTAHSPNLSDPQSQVFAQGADFIVTTKHHSAALWHTHTPGLEDLYLGAIGACELSENNEPEQFLRSCAEILHNDHGCDKVIGPMNGNTWLKHRLVIESNGRPPFLMEPIEPDFYKEAFENAGFEQLSTYCSHLVDLSLPQKDCSQLLNKYKKRGVTLRSVSKEKFEQDLISIFQLSLISFSHNHLYTPISQASFIGKYMESRELIDPDLVLMAESDGELVAYLFCIPDHAATQIGQKPAIILKTLASNGDKSFAGIGSLLVLEAQAIAKNKGYTEAIHALQHEDNSSTKISMRCEAIKFRRYALMSKSFQPQSHS